MFHFFLEWFGIYIILYFQFREFCAMVRKIYIYPKEEIQKMSPGTLSSKNEENQSGSEGADAKDVKCLPPQKFNYENGLDA